MKNLFIFQIDFYTSITLLNVQVFAVCFCLLFLYHYLCPLFIPCPFSVFFFFFFIFRFYLSFFCLLGLFFFSKKIVKICKKKIVKKI